MIPKGRVGTLAGWLLLWSLLPLPFLYIVLPPFWIVPMAVGLWKLVSPESRWKPSRLTLNLLGVVVLAVVIAAGGLGVGPLRPLGHLLLLLTAIRTATVSNLEDLRRAVPTIFLIGLVGIASAVHVTIMPYLLGSAIVWWYAGMQIFLMELSREGGVDLGRPRVRHAVVAGIAVAILTVPTFLLLPRLRSPLVSAPVVRQSGFSETVELARRGAISESDVPAMILSSVDGEPIPEAWLRLRAAALDQIHGGVSWVPRKTGLTRPVLEEGRVRLDAGRTPLEGLRSVDIALEERKRFLFLPAGSVALEIDEPVLIDPTGAVVPTQRDGPPPRYRVWLSEEPILRLKPPEARDLRLKNPDLRTARLATRITTDARDDEAKARAIERYLKTNYAYSLSGGGGGLDPVAHFLFESRKGHCEFFAAAMVELLRHEGVPARMVVGFHGGDADPGGDQVIVRRANAHAWVEVWLGRKRGWVVFDPTPAEGVDGLRRLGTLDRVRLMWETVENFFDRRILTFGLGEQIGLLTGFGEAMTAAADWIRRSFRWWWFVAAVLLGVAIRVIVRGDVNSSIRRRTPALRAVDRLLRRLRRRTVIPPSTTLGGIGSRAIETFPVAAGEIRALIRLAEDELYAPGPVSKHHAATVRRIWKGIRSGTRGAAGNRGRFR